MPTPAEYQAAVEKTVVNSDRLDDFVNGPAGGTVVTDNGAIPNLATVVSGIEGVEAGLSNFSHASTYAEGTVGAKLKGTISVKDAPYNAKGDGATDDSAAIEAADTAAKAAGVTLFFPAGTYIVAPDVISATTSWAGAGRDVSILKAKAVSFTNLTALVTFTSQSDFAVTDLGFDLSDGTYSAGVGNPGNLYFALSIVSSTRFAVERCKFTGIKAQTCGIGMNYVTYFGVRGNYFNMPTPSGSWNQACNISNSAGTSENYEFSDNVMSGTALFSEGRHGHIHGNTVEAWKFGGGLTFGPSANCAFNVITGNIIIGAPTTQDINSVWLAGIECWSPYSVISNNYVANCPGDGIGTGAYATIINGNTCLNNGRGDGTTSGVGQGISLNSVTKGGVDYYGSLCIVSNNILLDTQATKTQKYGTAEYVVSGPAMSQIEYSNNKISGFVTAKQLFTSGQRSYKGPQLYGAASCTVPSLSAGASFDETIFLAGVQQGDRVGWSYSGDSRGYSIMAHALANNVVLTVTNVSGSTKAAPVGQTWTVWVEKSPTTSGF